jgi:hypothetical protein
VRVVDVPEVIEIEQTTLSMRPEERISSADCSMARWLAMPVSSKFRAG